MDSSIVIKPRTCFNRCRSELTFQVMIVSDVGLDVFGVDTPLRSKCRDLDVESPLITGYALNTDSSTNIMYDESKVLLAPHILTHE